MIACGIPFFYMPLPVDTTYYIAVCIQAFDRSMEYGKHHAAVRADRLVDRAFVFPQVAASIERALGFIMIIKAAFDHIAFDRPDVPVDGGNRTRFESDQ